VADENGGKLKNRVVLFCDELGTMPAFDILPLFSAGRSRKLTLVPIIQSLAQLEKNYGKEGAEIIVDNTQLTISGGFAPNSTSADQISKALGSRTVLSGTVSKGKEQSSQSLQMIERPLMTADELRNLSKGEFIVMKTAHHPMKVRMKLFYKWGITFDENNPYVMTENGSREVKYACKSDIEKAIVKKYGKKGMAKPKTKLPEDSDRDQKNEPKERECPVVVYAPDGEETVVEVCDQVKDNHLEGIFNALNNN
jgi:type IV secretion system protein VirD4